MPPKKPLRPRALPKRRLPKPHKLHGDSLDNRELQDLVKSLGMRMVPENELTPVEELQNRLDRMLNRADAAFDAGRDASADIKKFAEVFIPLLNEVRKELAEHRNELVTVKNTVAELDRRVAALEQAKGNAA
jgi:phage shock protein A